MPRPQRGDGRSTLTLAAARGITVPPLPATTARVLGVPHSHWRQRGDYSSSVAGYHSEGMGVLHSHWRQRGGLQFLRCRLPQRGDGRSTLTLAAARGLQFLRCRLPQRGDGHSTLTLAAARGITVPPLSATTARGSAFHTHTGGSEGDYSSSVAGYRYLA